MNLCSHIRPGRFGMKHCLPSLSRGTTPSRGSRNTGIALQSYLSLRLQSPDRRSPSRRRGHQSGQLSMSNSLLWFRQMKQHYPHSSFSRSDFELCATIRPKGDSFRNLHNFSFGLGDLVFSPPKIFARPGLRQSNHDHRI